MIGRSLLHHPVILQHNLMLHHSCFGSLWETFFIQLFFTIKDHELQISECVLVLTRDWAREFVNSQPVPFYEFSNFLTFEIRARSSIETCDRRCNVTLWTLRMIFFISSHLKIFRVRVIFREEDIADHFSDYCVIAVQNFSISVGLPGFMLKTVNKLSCVFVLKEKNTPAHNYLYWFLRNWTHSLTHVLVGVDWKCWFRAFTTPGQVCLCELLYGVDSASILFFNFVVH